jgi:glutamyl-tRNA reductase
VHTDTSVDLASASLVAVGVAKAADRVGSLPGCSVLVCGAGATAALVVATLHRAGVRDFVIANRTPRRAASLAATVSARATTLDDVEETLATVDLVVSATGAMGVVIPADTVERAMKARDNRPLVALDLAMPRDIDPLVAGMEAVTLIDLEHLRAAPAAGPVTSDVDAAAKLAGAIVAEEVGRFLAEQRSVAVAPTVAALRSRAAALVDAELARLGSRLPQLDAAARAEVELAVRRVVATLLHRPTVRVKELANVPGGDAYAQALRELFELDPEATAVVTRALVSVEEEAP